MNPSADSTTRRWTPWLVTGGAMAVCSAIPGLNIIAVGWLYELMGRVGAGATPVVEAPGPGAVFRYLYLGVRGLAASLALLVVPATILAGSWWAGWVFSYEGVRIYLRWAHLAAVFSAFLLMPLLVYLPFAQVRFALTSRVSSFFEFAAVSSTIRARPWAALVCAACVPLQLGVLGISRLVLLWVGFSTPNYALVNFGSFAVAAAIHRHWAVQYSRSVAFESRQSPGIGRARFAQGALLVLIGLVTTLLMALVHFILSYGWADFYFHPGLLIPTAPYPMGWWVPDSTP